MECTLNLKNLSLVNSSQEGFFSLNTKQQFISQIAILSSHPLGGILSSQGLLSSVPL